MNFQSVRKLKSALILASTMSVTMAATQVFAQSIDVKSVVRGTPGPNFNASVASGPVFILTNNTSGYVGLNVPPLHQGFSNTENLGAFAYYTVLYQAPASADPGLKEILQDNAGFYHITTAATTSIPQGGNDYEYQALPSVAGEFSPAFIPANEVITKAAILFYGGAAHSITVTNIETAGNAPGTASSFACFGNDTTFFSFCADTGFDPHFNFELSSGNN